MKKSSQHQKNDLGFYIKENSMVARIAASKLRSTNVAIVLGKTIHLWNVDAGSFLNNEKWLNHELCHIRQYRRYGFVRFIILYLMESLRYGYRNNKFEVEARLAEKEKNV